MRMVLTLADLEAKGITRPTIACDRCPRRGSYAVARLFEQHDRDHHLVSLRLLLAADCPAYHAGARRRCAAPATRRYRACS